jgi:Tfp pilus assembly protein PilN
MKLNMKTALEMLRTGSVSPGLSRAKSRKWLKPLRMLGTKTALGLDISDKRISMALLKGSKNGVKLLASAGAPLPDGTIKNGSIENAEVLAKTIKSLRKRCRARTTRTAVSLFTEPVITQIMGIPKQVPGNIGQFVQEQVKHVAVLPANNIALDFRGVAGVGSDVNSASRLLVVAADDRKVDGIVKLCSQAELTVESIEPSLLAYTRALYANKIAGKFDCNILIAILQSNTLTLCVFKKQAMDFIRTKAIGSEKTQPEEISQWLAEQINAVIQFYDVEVQDSAGKWDITVVADDAQLPRSAEMALRAKVANAGLQIMTDKDICQAAVISQPRKLADADEPSAVAIGLAMKLLDKDVHNLGVNLLPHEVARIRAAQKGALITVNIIAVTMLIMILAVAVPQRKIASIDKSIDRKKVNLLQNARILSGKRASLNEQIDTVSNQINQINAILGSRHDTDWPGLLKDIGKAIPKTACVTSLSGGAGPVMSLKGMAASNEAVYWFADKLSQSEQMSSASIVQTERDSRGLVKYEISCTLASKKGK